MSGIIWNGGGSGGVSGTGLPQYGYIKGIVLSNNGTDANNDIDITSGETLDSSAEILISVSALIKRLDATFVAGTNQGMLDTGAKAANKMYAVWAICKEDGSAGDILASLSFSAPTMPATYTRKQLVGVVFTNISSNLFKFLQSYNYFGIQETFNDLTDNTLTAATFETATLRVPPNSLANLTVDLAMSSVGGASPVYDKEITLRYPGSTTTHALGNFTFCATPMTGPIGSTWTSSQTIRLNGTTWWLMDANSELEYAANEPAGTSTLIFNINGFEMLTRGKV